MAVEKVLIKWQAVLRMRKIATSFFSKKPIFVAVIKAGEGKVPTECSDQRASSFFALSLSGNFLPCQLKTSSSNPVTLDSPHVTHVRQPHPCLLREYPTVCFTMVIKGFVVCRHLLKYNMCAFLWLLWIKLPLQLVTATSR